MSDQSEKTAASPAKKRKVEGPQKRWGTKTAELPQYVMDGLYQSADTLDKAARTRLGLMMKVPVFIQDPLVALDYPTLGIEEIEVRFEKDLFDGPTSSRIAVVDINADTQKLLEPLVWVKENGWFRKPGDQKGWLPDAPRGKTNTRKYEKFIRDMIKDPYFHQLNAWAVVERVLEFYEHPFALGRPVPWGFDGTRLLVVPHAGYGENAYYDRSTKSLQFFYFGDPAQPGFTCLSHDIIAHETAHAVLDGIRPLYMENPSVQTSAFHEFIGDLTAILLAIDNRDIRHSIADLTQGNLSAAEVLANIAEQFGEVVEERKYLRTALNQLSLKDEAIRSSLSAHKVSQVLTGAMFDILIGIARKHMEKNLLGDLGSEPGRDIGLADEADLEPASESEEAEQAGPQAAPAASSSGRVSPKRALYWAAERFRRVALQPLDLCPPCDVQFLDYARAVIRNDVLTNPVDPEGYREVMLETFHRRGLCDCAYRPGEVPPEDCQFLDVLLDREIDFISRQFVYHPVSVIASSRTDAYYFLSDNRRPLRIPRFQDVVVSDLYINRKLGALAEKLPRQVVLEYTWKELVTLKNDSTKGYDFGKFEGKTVELFCGGTLVFDERGNLLSWLHKPGTEHITAGQAEAIRQKMIAWQANRDLPLKERPTKLELAELADYEAGQERIETLLQQYHSRLKKKLVGLAEETASLPKEFQKPVTAFVEDGVLRFSNTPHLRKEDVDEELGWKLNY
jgi:hypothetical protein